MRTNDSYQNTSRSRTDSRTGARSRSDARTRKPAPRSSTRKRAVGATAISAPGANAIGLTRRNATRPYGRGETARRVEASRAEYISARPAVYTDEGKRGGLFSRLRLPEFQAPSLSMPAVPTWFIVAVALAIAVVVVAGPARNYYLAWREAGMLEVEYEVVSAQNEDLNHQIDRLQTIEGIEDEARSRGYVYPNEEALVVSELETSEAAEADLVQEALDEYEKSLPWYVNVLDAVFGYKSE